MAVGRQLMIKAPSAVGHLMDGQPFQGQFHGRFAGRGGPIVIGVLPALRPGIQARSGRFLVRAAWQASPSAASCPPALSSPRAGRFSGGASGPPAFSSRTAGGFSGRTSGPLAAGFACAALDGAGVDGPLAGGIDLRPYGRRHFGGCHDGWLRGGFGRGRSKLRFSLGQDRGEFRAVNGRFGCRRARPIIVAARGWHGRFPFDGCSFRSGHRQRGELHEVHDPHVDRDHRKQQYGKQYRAGPPRNPALLAAGIIPHALQR